MSSEPKTIGRPLGKGNLTDEVKIGVLQQKKLQIFSQGRIAQDFQLSRKTVNQLSEDDLSPNGKLLLQDFTNQLETIRTKTADLIIEKLNNKTIKDGVLPTLLNIANQNYRLETNQPTAITSDENTQRLAQATRLLIAKKQQQYIDNGVTPPSIDEILDGLESALQANNVTRDALKTAMQLDAPESE